MLSLSPVRVLDCIYDRILDVETGGTAPSDFADAHQYSTLSHFAASAIVNHFALTVDDVFVDIGAGKGRVVCCAARRALRESIGIEVDEALYEVALRNKVTLRGRKSHMAIENIFAQDFDYRRGTVFYLFNPFGQETLRKVLGCLEASLTEAPRLVRIAYVNPVYEHVFEEFESLKCYERWEAGSRLFLPHKVSFWSLRYFSGPEAH